MYRKLVLTGCIFLLLPVFSVNLVRINNKRPIVDKSMFDVKGIPSDGENINGPSIIRLPDWLPIEQRAHPTAKYYLYFAHHHGNYIRMAWAAEITGKWNLYNADSTISVPHRGVLGLMNKFDNSPKILPGNGIEIYSHIASPVVLVDHANQRFALFFHGVSRHTSDKKSSQRTFISYSNDGLNFQDQISPIMLAGSYLSPFRYKNRWYGFSNGGLFHQAPASTILDTTDESFDYSTMLWSTREDFFTKAVLTTQIPDFRVRHSSVYVHGDSLHIFFSSSRDTPERIYYTRASLTDKSENWSSENFRLVFTANEKWEGGDVEPVLSVGGAAKTKLNEVRDPFVFKDTDGEFYLLYCAGGEQAIGIAQILNFP